MHRDFPVKTILAELERDNLLPCILFRTARRQVDADLTALSRVKRIVLPAADQRHIHHEIAQVIAKYSLQEDVIFHHPQYPILLSTGVGGHHAGQLLAWRLLLEELMSRGLLRLLIATGTVAAGVDFPARSVVVTAHSRRSSEGFTIIPASEFQQMSGRAGRRGKDTVGFCIVAPSPYCDARVIHDVANRPAEPLKSSYFAAPSTVLNLLKFRNVDDLEYTVVRSLASFHDRKEAMVLYQEAQGVEAKLSEESGERLKKATKRVARLRREGENIEKRQQGLLKRTIFGLEVLGFIQDGKLTEKGSWAAELCTSVVIELAETIDAGLLYDLDSTQLAGMVAAIAGDPHRSYFNLKPNPIDRKLFKSLESVIARIREQYESPSASEIAVLPDAALTVITWMECEDWNDFSGLLRLAKVAEGDAARLITQTADHLNQIARLTETHPGLAKVAEEARFVLLRPPITDTYVGG